jgi:hypothetical protein
MKFLKHGYLLAATASLTLLASAPTFAGCAMYAAAPPNVVYVAPPRTTVYVAPGPRAVYVAPAPRPAIWVPGHWVGGIWVPGHWA